MGGVIEEVRAVVDERGLMVGQADPISQIQP